MPVSSYKVFAKCSMTNVGKDSWDGNCKLRNARYIVFFSLCQICSKAQTCKHLFALVNQQKFHSLISNDIISPHNDLLFPSTY